MRMKALCWKVQRINSKLGIARSLSSRAINSLDLLQESGTRTYPTQKQTSYGRNSLSLSSAKHGTAERDLHADIYSAELLQEVSCNFPQESFQSHSSPVGLQLEAQRGLNLSKRELGEKSSFIRHRQAFRLPRNDKKKRRGENFPSPPSLFPTIRASQC